MIKIFYDLDDIPVKFTGVCKIISNNSIRHLKNGDYHREDGPAIESENGDKFWYINGLEHREDGPAIEYIGGGKQWLYKGEEYGTDYDFTDESWKEFIENKKREEGLKIFK
jgi:hypothetical protein